MEAKNQTYLLYDEQCPFCAWYTGWFILKGWLQPEDRYAFQQAEKDPDLKFDRELAKNKIALIQLKSGEVTYGIDSLLIILGKPFPWIKKTGHFPPIYFLLKLLYLFISYNRKVIAPVHVCETNCDCAPSQSWLWRFIYIVFAGLIVHVTVGYYFHHFLENEIIQTALPDLYLYSIQFGFQFFWFKLFKQTNFYDYAGHLATISLIGAFSLITVSFLLQLLNLVEIDLGILPAAGFGFALTNMLIMHVYRNKKLGFSRYLSLTWIIFRILIYSLVFKR